LRLRDANEAANKVFKACVDFDKSTPEMLAAVSEYLATLSPEMMRRVTTLREGILLKTKYLPTVADFHALVKELEAKDNQFKSAHTTYRRLSPDNFENEKTPEQRKAFIASLDLRKQFPDGLHLRDQPVRVLWDKDEEPTEAVVKPEGSKFETPKEFPKHLLETNFIKGYF